MSRKYKKLFQKIYIYIYILEPKISRVLRYNIPGLNQLIKKNDHVFLENQWNFDWIQRILSSCQISLVLATIVTKVRYFCAQRKEINVPR